MSWSEIATGQFQRVIGENETFLKLLGDSGHSLRREHWAVNGIASFAPVGSLAREDLRSLLLKAWKCLRFDHPSIAARPDDAQHFVYTVPDSSALRQWADETFAVVEGQTADDLVQTLKPNSCMTMTYLPDTHEIVFHTAHWRTDGIGILQLLNAFFDRVTDASSIDPDSLAWGQEPDRLAPAIEEAADIPSNPNDATKALGRTYVETFTSIAGSVGLSFRGDVATLPAGTRSSRLAISKTNTATIVDRCKVKGISVTAAVHAAVALGNRDLAAPENRDKHFTSTVRFSLRPYLPEPYCLSAYASGLYTTGWMHAVSTSVSWAENAKAYQDIYSQGLSKDYIRAHREYARGLGDLIRNMPQGGEPPSSVDIGSIGIAEHSIERTKGTKERGLEILSVSVGVEVLTREGVCFVWTFRDQIHLHLVHNEKFHNESDSAAFLAKVRDILFEELGVEEE